ncbi:hypothetical protein BTW10_10290 [Chromohalobacter japonicus]|uniref:Uncharacterized protein n=1 Tax=Chromohalobacter japonicus TaxID=223900 RepID=A0A1Q8TBW9_9GAMM|nr:hypothetical protein BTW10_10290 [Chromohalobacter japonicus]
MKPPRVCLWYRPSGGRLRSSSDDRPWRALQAIDAAQRNAVPGANPQGVTEARCQTHACRETVCRLVEVAATLVMQVATVPVVVAMDIGMGVPMVFPFHRLVRRLARCRAQRPMGTRLAGTGQHQARDDEQQQEQVAETMAQPVEHE